MLVRKIWQFYVYIVFYFRSNCTRQLIGLPSEIVIGDTPCIPLAGRGGEIRAWLDAHPECTSFVVIDDDHESSILAHLGAEHFVHTILRSSSGDLAEEGLTSDMAVRALQILMQDEAVS